MLMSKFSKKFFVLALAGALSFSATGVAFAASDAENSVTGFFRRLFNYPVKATQKAGESTEHTLQNTGENLSKAGESTASTLSGDPATGLNQAGESIQGGLETTGQAVAETVAIPVEAAQEDAPAVPAQQ
jgi:hypothetical protein